MYIFKITILNSCLSQNVFLITLYLFTIFVLHSFLAYAETNGLTNNALHIKRVSIREHLVSRGASGNTANEVLKSVALDEKINHELLEFLGVNLDGVIDSEGWADNRWEDSRYIRIAIRDNDDRKVMCDFDKDTGRLERYRESISLGSESLQGMNDDDLNDHIISKEKALTIVKQLLSVAGIDLSVKPEKLEFNRAFQWHYYDPQEYDGILCQSALHVRVDAVSGEVLGFSFYNLHIAHPEKKEPVVTEESALQIASEWIEKTGRNFLPEVMRLLYAPGSNIWSGKRDIDPFITEDKFRLCWYVNLKDAAQPKHLSGNSVYVDAITGEIVGGEDWGM